MALKPNPSERVMSVANHMNDARRISRSVAEVLDEWESERGLRSPAHAATYVSVPLTTGRTFVEWLREHGRNLAPDSAEYITAHRADVMLPNVQRAARFIELLRWRHNGLVIDPTTLTVDGWGQEEYHQFWLAILDRHVRRAIFLDGWEYSNGCTLEFETAIQLGLDCVDEHVRPLNVRSGLRLIDSAIHAIHNLGLSPASLYENRERLAKTKQLIVSTSARDFYKDEVLDHLARTANVAQFVSFGPGSELQRRYSRIVGYPANVLFKTPIDAIYTLLDRSPEGAVNIRSFDPEQPEGNPFIKNLRSVDEIVSAVRQLADERRLYTIVNESIDEHDGGVSGVAYRGALEFAPDSTPRCVEDVDVERCMLPFDLGMALLSDVYMFTPDLLGRDGARVEFSVHPKPRGWRATNTILWEVEQRPDSDLTIEPNWPNRFSRMLGDKAFGLAVAAAAKLAVPRTVVFSRRLFPFSFGQSIGTGVVWTRPSPEVKTPGFYPSHRGWQDPVAVLAASDTAHDASRRYASISPVASVLIQEGVEAVFSGKLVLIDDEVAIEGVPGEGDAFMIGDRGSADLPQLVIDAVRDSFTHARALFGSIELEWVFDGSYVWIVQVNKARPTRGGKAAADEAGVTEWEDFLYRKGAIEEYRARVNRLVGTGKGISVIGNVSPLSHLGEIAAVAGVPVRFLRRSG